MATGWLSKAQRLGSVPGIHFKNCAVPDLGPLGHPPLGGSMMIRPNMRTCSRSLAPPEARRDTRMGSVGRAFSAHIFELQGTSPHTYATNQPLAMPSGLCTWRWRPSPRPSAWTAPSSTSKSESLP